MYYSLMPCFMYSYATEQVYFTKLPLKNSCLTMNPMTDPA